MKKHLSMLTLYARSTCLPFLAVLAAMAAASIARFSHKLEFNLTTIRIGDNMDSLEQLIDYSNIALIFGLAFLLVTILLCLPGCRFGSRTDYTFGRLSLDERALFFSQVGYNAVCYLILWGVQLATLLACAALYLAQAPADAVSPQTVLLACYRVPLLHALLPLGNWPVWLRNLLFLCGISLSSARVPVCRRRGKMPVAVIVMALVFFAFPRIYSEMAIDIIVFWPIVFVIALTLHAAIHGEEDDHA